MISLKNLGWRWRIVARNLLDLRLVFLLALALSAFAAPVEAANLLREYSPMGLTAADINHRADAILAKLTLVEKLRLMTGNQHEALHSLKAIGLPSVRVSDATVGVVDWGASTAFPAAPCLSSAWSRSLALMEGRAIGRDARARSVGILLGPGVNILREPQCGRSMEYLGGEDPLLSSALVTQFVRGLQSEHVAACVKHFAGNEIETQRPWVNCVISRRALEEIYLPPFRAAVVHGHAWAIMTACNRINGWYGSESAFLLNDMLRRHWGFKGLVMTDWGCSYNTLTNLTNGLDLEMPARKMYTLAAVKNLLARHKITMELIDQHARRILRLFIALGYLDARHPLANVSPSGPRRLALVDQIAAEGTVLLKNRGDILPLQGPRTVVLAGPWMTRVQTGGGGSSHVPPDVTPVPLSQALHAAMGPAAHFVVIPWRRTFPELWGRGKLTAPDGHAGLLGEYFSNAGFAGKPKLRVDKVLSFNFGGPKAHAPRMDSPANVSLDMMKPPAADNHGPFSAIWKASLKVPATGDYSFSIAVSGSAELYLDGKRIVDLWVPFWQPQHPLKGALATRHLVVGRVYQLRVVYRSIANKPAQLEFGYGPASSVKLLTAQQAAIVKHADVVIAGIGFGMALQREQADRPYHFSPPQDAYVHVLASLNPHTVVVAYAGAGASVSGWIHQVAGLLWAWYPGQTGNRAIADIITGKIDPSGRLPDTFARHKRDEPAYGNFFGQPPVFSSRWPDEPEFDDAMPSVAHSTCVFKEGIFVGYRWYDKRAITPRFCFGYGLSYTSFTFDSVHVSKQGSEHARVITVSVRLTNTGKRAGAEVVQVYVHPPKGPIDRCVQTLKGFQRVELAPGQSATVHIPLNWRAFACFDSRTKKWTVPSGLYSLGIGDSSRHEPLSADIKW